MPTFGRYETVRELRSGVVSVHAAREAGSSPQAEPNFTVKTFRPPVSIIGREAAQGQARSFLEQARAQQQLAGQCGGVLAPVHDLGAADGECFFVTDLYPRSIQTLIAGRIRLQPQQLQHVVGRIAAALQRLHSHAGRGHGNLKPGNVFLTGTDPSSSNVVLTDPKLHVNDRTAGPGRDTDFSNADLRGLGELIHELVTHRPAMDDDHWSAPDSPEWKRLGSQAQAWRELCNQLLAARISETPITIDDAIERIAKLRPAGRGKRILAGAVVGVLALALGIVAYLWWSPANNDVKPIVIPEGARNQMLAWRRFCVEYTAWVANYDEGRDKRARVVTSTPFDVMPNKVFAQLVAEQPSEAAVRTAVEQLGRIEELRDSILPDIKELAATATTLNAFAPRLAAMLHQAAERARPPGVDEIELAIGAEDPRQIQDECDKLRRERYQDHLKAARELTPRLRQIESNLVAIESNWNDAIQPLDDPVLNQFKHIMERELSSVDAEPEADRLRLLLQKIEGHAKSSNQIAQLASRFWRWNQSMPFSADQIDYDSFRAAGHQFAEPYTSTTLELWQGEVVKFTRLDPAGDPRVELRSNSEKLRPAAEKLSIHDDVRQLYGQVATGLGSAAMDQQKTPWARAHRSQIEQSSEAMRRDIQALQKSIGKYTEDLDVNWQLLKEALAFDSKVLEAEWTRRRDAAMQGYDQPDYSVWNDLNELKQAYLALDESLPVNLTLPREPANWNLEAVKPKVAQKREAIIRAALESPDAARWENICQPYIEWVEEAQRLVADSVIIEQAFDEGAGLHAAAGDQTIAGVFARVQANVSFADLESAIEPLLRRVEFLQSVEQAADGTELRRLAEQSLVGSGPEASASAWSRLGDVQFADWPRSIDELEIEGRLQARVKETAATSKNGSVQSELRDALQQQGPARWGRCLARLASEQDVVRALAMRSQFGIEGPEQIADEKIRLICLVYDLAADLDAIRNTSRGKQAYEAFVARVRTAIDQLNSLSMANDMKMAAPLQEFTREKATPLENLGPGTTQKWIPDQKSDDESVTYTWKNHKLTFIRVNDDEPAFVCTTEMPLGLALEWINELNVWNDFADLVEPRAELRASGNQAMWPGPRVWEWIGRGPRMQLARFWLEERAAWRQTPVYPQAFLGQNNRELAHKGGDPHLDHPIQHIPVSAAIFLAQQFGCRLPTLADWADARAKSSAGAAPKHNLRDATWAAQLNHIKTLKASQTTLQDEYYWPWLGMFQPGGADIADRERADANDDGVLWFDSVAPASANNVKAFHHLVGNVAEFVFQSGKPEAVNVDLSMFDKRGLFNWTEANVRVIGGSALSHPQFSNEQPHEISLRITMASLPSFADVGFRLSFSAEGAIGAGQVIADALTVVENFKKQLLPGGSMSSGS